MSATTRIDGNLPGCRRCGGCGIRACRPQCRDRRPPCSAECRAARRRRTSRPAARRGRRTARRCRLLPNCAYRRSAQCAHGFGAVMVQREDQHGERRQRFRPDDALVIVVLFNGGRHDARHTDAIAAHQRRQRPCRRGPAPRPSWPRCTCGPAGRCGPPRCRGGSPACPCRMAKDRPPPRCAGRRASGSGRSRPQFTPVRCASFSLAPQTKSASAAAAWSTTTRHLQAHRADEAGLGADGFQHPLRRWPCAAGWRRRPPSAPSPRSAHGRRASPAPPRRHRRHRRSASSRSARPARPAASPTSSMVFVAGVATRAMAALAAGRWPSNAGVEASSRLAA